MILIYSKITFLNIILSICDIPCTYSFDYYKIAVEDLLEFSIDLDFLINKPSIMHGITCWFDTYFTGTSKEIVLSTSPYNNPTHWYQLRLLLPEPLAINKGQKSINIAHLF